MPVHQGERKKGVWILWLIAGGIFTSFFVFCLLVLVVVLSDGYAGAGFSLPGQDRIGLVEVIGPIYSSAPVLQQLENMTEHAGVDALVLRIDSPGGSVVAAQEVYRELNKLREREGLVILASMGNVAASGGYYIACAADRIVASPGTITGSIGVIATWTQYDELLSWARLKNVVIKSGQFKDTGNPAREMTDTEVRHFQSLVDELHGQFVAAVSESRGLPEDEVARLGDGRVFTGVTALELDLIDEIGNLSDTLERAAELAGIEDDYRLLRRRRDRPLSILDLIEGYVISRLGEALDAESPPAGNGGFHYLWRPRAAEPVP